jgi:hypothetical protein
MNNSTFDYLFRKMVNQEFGLTYGLSEELSSYMKYYNHDEIKQLYWMVQNGYSKKHIKELIFKMTGKTTEELDNDSNNNIEINEFD